MMGKELYRQRRISLAEVNQTENDFGSGDPRAKRTSAGWGIAAAASIAVVYGVLQSGAFREVTVVVVFALGVLLAAASMMGSRSEGEIIKRSERLETLLARLVDKVES